MDRSAPQKWLGLLSFLGENRNSWRFDCNLCTVLYFEHIGEGLKAVFDAAESPREMVKIEGFCLRCSTLSWGYGRPTKSTRCVAASKLVIE